MKPHPTAGPKIAQTIAGSWWSLVSASATTPAPHTRAAEHDQAHAARCHRPILASGAPARNRARGRARRRGDQRPATTRSRYRQRAPPSPPNAQLHGLDVLGLARVLADHVAPQQRPHRPGMRGADEAACVRAARVAQAARPREEPPRRPRRPARPAGRRRRPTGRSGRARSGSARRTRGGRAPRRVSALSGSWTASASTAETISTRCPAT